jgi:predicted acylesterase/phospholipase RssA
MTIKHLVLSGGGPTMLQTIGVLYYLETNDYLSFKNIETIYGTSAGTIIGTIIALNFDWETVNDYLIKRPWQDVFPINIKNILDAYNKKGLFDETNIKKCFQPLFDAKNISIDINLEDFYNLTKIELHFITFEINEYKTHDISVLTHPKLSIITAIQMSCCLPILFTPVFIEDKCYIDGGMTCNYPLNYCIESGKDLDEILGIKNKYSENNNFITSEINLLQFLFNFFYKTIFSISIDK